MTFKVYKHCPRSAFSNLEKNPTRNPLHWPMYMIHTFGTPMYVGANMLCLQDSRSISKLIRCTLRMSLASRSFALNTLKQVGALSAYMSWLWCNLTGSKPYVRLQPFTFTKLLYNGIDDFTANAKPSIISLLWVTILTEFQTPCQVRTSQHFRASGSLQCTESSHEALLAD